jgi:hypothetical protein
MATETSSQSLVIDDGLPPLSAAEWQDPWWRITHLYWIVDETGKPVRFSPNEEQEQFYRSLWFRNLILKARQLGFSTELLILALDQCLFVENFAAGVIADSLENAGKLFRKVLFAYNRLPEMLKAVKPLVKESGSELIVANGSSISVGTSMRSGTLQFLHVSEFGKICRKYPDKAREIVTGAFEAVAAGNMLTIESTADGAYGSFYDFTMDALRRQQAGEKHTPLDFRLHFFPWWRKAAYRIDPAGVVIPAEFVRYFELLESRHGIRLDAAQKAWYVKKEAVLKGDMKREYPSFPEEAFEAVIEGAIYGNEMAWLRKNNRITSVPWESSAPVNTFWDLGLDGANSIWFHQRVGLENRFIRYYENSGYGLRHYVTELHRLRDELGWVFGRHYLPHDVETSMLDEDGRSRRDVLEGLGMRNIETVSRISDVETGIEVTRESFSGCWFDREHCDGGIKCLDHYQREWDDRLGRYRLTPLGNWASHGADAFRQFAQGYEGEKKESKPLRRRGGGMAR